MNFIRRTLSNFGLWIDRILTGQNGDVLTDQNGDVLYT